MIEKEMFIKNGAVIRADDVYLDPRDATIEAQAAEIEQLRMQLKAAALWTAEPGTTVAEIRAAFGETE